LRTEVIANGGVANVWSCEWNNCELRTSRYALAILSSQF
jgi:hypothetical protein